MNSCDKKNRHDVNGKRSVAVIGASYLQLPLVLKAKEMGLRTICFAWPKDAVCKDHCDSFYPVSIVEKERILEICGRERVDGVLTVASDVAVPTVSYVATALGLQGNSVKSAFLSTNKYAMREVLSNAGLPVPAFRRISSAADTTEEGLKYPLIVKPCDRSGSLGVSKVSEPSKLKEAVVCAIGCSLGGDAIVEEFVSDAREVSVEGISYGGQYHFLAVTDKVTTGAPHFVEIEQHQPADLDETKRDEIVRIVSRAVTALGIECGASHAELMLTSDGRVLITEIGARMGGDFIGSDLVRLSTGYDFLRGVIECALGEFTVPVTEKLAFSGVFFSSSETREVRDFIEEGRMAPHIIHMALTGSTVGDRITCSAERDGYVIYRTASRIRSVEELKRLL